jgi:hypothetical protein
MQLAWETLLAQARANQATAEATLLTMRSHASVMQCRGEELQAWELDAHGIADVAQALVESQRSAEDGAHVGGSGYASSSEVHVGAPCGPPKAVVSSSQAPIGVLVAPLEADPAGSIVMHEGAPPRPPEADVSSSRPLDTAVIDTPPGLAIGASWMTHPVRSK